MSSTTASVNSKSSNNSNTQTTTVIKLDNGVLAKIMNNHNIEKPKLQVLNIRNINTTQNQNDRYLILLSDGDYFESACLLLPNLNNYVRTQKLKKETIIQLDKYALNSIPNGKVLVIVEITIICTEYPKIGNPVALTQKQPSTATNTNSTTTKQQQQQQLPQQKSKENGNNNNNEDMIEEICKCSNCQDKNTILLCYKMLGLNENATKEEVKSRYIHLTNENNEKLQHDSKLAEKFEIMTKAYTLIMGMKSSETDEESEKTYGNSNHNHNHNTNGGADEEENKTKTKSKIKIPLEDFLQYAWLKAADECSYDTDSDSDCEVNYHRRKNRNPKAFYQQMKKSNKTISIKAIKKRAKEVSTTQSLNNDQTTTNINKNSTNSTINNNIKLQTNTKINKSNDENSKSSNTNETTSNSVKLNEINKQLELNKNKNKSNNNNMESSSFSSSSSASTSSSSSSEIKITIKKENDLNGALKTGNIKVISQNTKPTQVPAVSTVPTSQPTPPAATTTTSSSKKKKNKKKKNKLNQQNVNKNNTQQAQNINVTQTTKISLPPPPPPPPPPIAANLINELKSNTNKNMINTKDKNHKNDNSKTETQQKSKCSNIYHNHHKSTENIYVENECENDEYDNEDESYVDEDEEEGEENNGDGEDDDQMDNEDSEEDDDDDDNEDDDEDDYEEEDEDRTFTSNKNKQQISVDSVKNKNEVAVSTIAANIENITSALIPKDDSPESKNLKEKLKNIVFSLQSLQKVFDTSDLKLFTKLSTTTTTTTTSNKTVENSTTEANNNKKESSEIQDDGLNSNNIETHAIITANLISNIEKLISNGNNNSETTNNSTNASNNDNTIVYGVKNTKLELSECDLKKSHDSMLSELVERRNEINNARNRKLLKHQQYYQQLTQNNELNASIIDHLNDLKTITLSTCMSHIEDFKINYKLLANNHELVLDKDGKLSIKSQPCELVNNNDNVQTLSSLASESLKNSKQNLKEQSHSEQQLSNDQQDQQLQQQQGKKKNKKKQRQQENSNDISKNITQPQSQKVLPTQKPKQTNTEIISNSNNNNSNSSSNNSNNKENKKVNEVTKISSNPTSVSKKETKPQPVDDKNKKTENNKKKKSKATSKSASTTAIPQQVNNEKQQQQHQPQKEPSSNNNRNNKNSSSKTSSTTTITSSQSIPIIKLPSNEFNNKNIKQNHNNLSDLDSFSLDSICSSVNSLVTTTNYYHNYFDNNDYEKLSDNEMLKKNDNNKNNEDEELSDDGGDWIQVKKPARNSAVLTTNDLNNAKINQKHSTSDINVNHKYDIKSASKSISHDLNKKSTLTVEPNPDNNAWNRSNSLSNTLMPKKVTNTNSNATANTNNNNNNKLKTEQTKKPSANSITKTDNELLDLIPKSIDEEEIMLKKALELSLKDSEENKVKQSTKNENKNENNLNLTSQNSITKPLKQKKFDCIDDFSIDIDLNTTKKDSTKDSQQQNSKPKEPKVKTSQQQPQIKLKSPPQTTNTILTNNNQAKPNKISPSKAIKIDSNTQQNSDNSTKTSPQQPIRMLSVSDEKHKKVSTLNLSSSYTNGMSYAAKSALKVADDNSKVNLISSSKSTDTALATNFISAEEFPPMTVHNSKPTLSSIVTSTSATAIHTPTTITTTVPNVTINTANTNKPTAASLFTNNRSSKTNSVKIPTQTVAPLPQENLQSRSLSPVKKPITPILVSPINQPNLVEPINSISLSNIKMFSDIEPNFEEPLLDENKLGPIINNTVPIPIIKSPFDTSLRLTPNENKSDHSISLIHSKSLEHPNTSNVIGSRKSSGTLSATNSTIKKPSLNSSDFKDNGIDLPIDSTSNTPNVDSPKKAVGAERPIGFKANLPTAIVAPIGTTGSFSNSTTNGASILPNSTASSIPVISPSLQANTILNPNSTKPIGSGLSQLPSAIVAPMQHQQTQPILRDVMSGINNEIPLGITANQFVKTPPPGIQNMTPLVLPIDNNLKYQQSSKLFNTLSTTVPTSTTANLFDSPQLYKQNKIQYDLLSQINTTTANMANNAQIMQMFKTFQTVGSSNTSNSVPLNSYNQFNVPFNVQNQSKLTNTTTKLPPQSPSPSSSSASLLQPNPFKLKNSQQQQQQQPPPPSPLSQQLQMKSNVNTLQQTFQKFTIPNGNAINLENSNMNYLNLE